MVIAIRARSLDRRMGILISFVDMGIETFSYTRATQRTTIISKDGPAA